MDIVLIKLLLAHIIGDFILQPNQWVAEKERLKLKSNKLYLHIAIHIALIFLLLGSLSVWQQALLIGISHLMIDAGKLLFQNEQNKRLLFFADQIAHLAVIFFVWRTYYQPYIQFGFWQNEQLLRFILGALFLTIPAGIIIKVAVAKWIPVQNGTSLQNAGKFIGILERLLIFVFIITHHFEAVGFLLAAKSIFRFGDLKEAHDIKLTEYVLIGTLLSFAIAIAVAMLLFI